MILSRERSASSSQPEARDAAPARSRWVYPTLMIVGMILVLVSVVLMLRDAAPAHAGDACQWILRM